MAYAWGSVFSAAAAGASAAAITVSVTYSAGDRVQVGITYGNNVTLTETVSDGTNTYSKLGSTLNIAGNSQSYAIYECKSASAGTFTLSFTPGASVPFRAVFAARQTGLHNSTAGQEVGNQQSTPGTGANAITSTNLTPASQPGMMMGYTVDDNGSAVTINAGTGFTSRGTITNWDSTNGVISRVEDERLTATTALASTFTASSAPGQTVAFAVFVPEPAGGGGITVKNLAAMGVG